jgi:hypothetical protein
LTYETATRRPARPCAETRAPGALLAQPGATREVSEDLAGQFRAATAFLRARGWRVRHAWRDMGSLSGLALREGPDEVSERRPTHSPDGKLAAPRKA